MKFWLIGLNIFIVLIVLAVVLFNPGQSSTASLLNNAQPVQASAVPVDQLASVAVALTVARMTNLPESAAVVNQADSARIQLAISSTDNTIVDKPQLVSTIFVSNKDIHTYVTQANDTISAIAAQFGVSSNSIIWSNSLSNTPGASLAAGKTLLIPPVNGIVYTVQSGDTTASLAQKYHADADKITATNDAEISGLHAGEQIIIPDGTIVTPVYTAYSSYGYAWGSSAIYGFNGYDYGNCTWYVATQIAVPANWGNAATWAAGARAAGWHVSSTPTVGAIAQTPYAAGGLGHVGIVTAVTGDQVSVKDMNNYGDGGGFGKVGQETVSASLYPNYITAP